MSLSRHIPLLYFVALFDSLTCLPHATTYREYDDIQFNKLTVKSDDPEQGQIIFDRPQVHFRRWKVPKVQSRIQFPEIVPERDSNVFGKTRRHQPPKEFQSNPEIFNNPTLEILDTSSTKYNSNESYSYYWLRQWLKNNIVIADKDEENEVRRRLIEIEKFLEHEALRSGYLSLLQTPSLKKKNPCSYGQILDHFGRCRVRLTFKFRE